MAHIADAHWRQRPGFDRLCSILGASEGLVRLVGGVVRDVFLGLAVNDIDLATILKPDQVTERLTAAGIKVVPTGILHGTVTALMDGKPFEITTLRRDVATDGRRATIEYTEDWREDAARRDFTINALYADPLTGQIFDYHGGLEDLEHKRVRFIGDPDQRIAEDHLRILRYFRFLARFGTLPPDAEAYAACVANANSLMALSRERIADELMKLLALPDPSAVVGMMITGGIFAPVLPEIDHNGLKRLEKLLERERELEIACIPSAILRFAALIPPDKATGEHISARLKLSNRARKQLDALLTPPPPHRHARELVYRVGKEAALGQMLLGTALIADDMTALAHWDAPHFPIGGAAILALGVSAGPDVSRLLQAIKEQWIAEGFPDRERTHAIAEVQVSTFLRESQNS